MLVIDIDLFMLDRYITQLEARHSIRVHNSRRPLNHLALCDPVSSLTFDLLLIGGWGLMMGYPCSDFGVVSMSN